MGFREAKKVLRSVTMACWWQNGREDRTAILSEAAGFLTYPCNEARRYEVEQAIGVYYRKG